VKNELGQRVVELRFKKGLTQVELAKKSKVCQGAISAIERGRIEPSIKTLRAIAKALGVSMVDMFSGLEWKE
jgi:transcriptional regulator with XRE-family HTH domain